VPRGGGGDGRAGDEKGRSVRGVRGGMGKRRGGGGMKMRRG